MSTISSPFLWTKLTSIFPRGALWAPQTIKLIFAFLLGCITNPVIAILALGSQSEHHLIPIAQVPALDPASVPLPTTAVPPSSPSASTRSGRPPLVANVSHMGSYAGPSTGGGAAALDENFEKALRRPRAYTASSTTSSGGYSLGGTGGRAQRPRAGSRASSIFGTPGSAPFQPSPNPATGPPSAFMAPGTPSRQSRLRGYSSASLRGGSTSGEGTSTDAPPVSSARSLPAAVALGAPILGSKPGTLVDRMRAAELDAPRESVELRAEAAGELAETSREDVGAPSVATTVVEGEGSPSKGK